MTWSPQNNLLGMVAFAGGVLLTLVLIILITLGLVFYKKLGIVFSRETNETINGLILLFILRVGRSTKAKARINEVRAGVAETASKNVVLNTQPFNQVLYKRFLESTPPNVYILMGVAALIIAIVFAIVHAVSTRPATTIVEDEPAALSE